MEADKTLVREKMLEWDRLLDGYQLPGWDEFPELPLYMDQVIYLMNQYLSPLYQAAEQKLVTPAMINNYVKLGIIPRPAKKRYGRVHLAFLIMVCLLKQTISIVEIKKLIPAALEEEDTKSLYESFLAVFQGGKNAFLESVRRDAAPVFEPNGASVTSFVFRAAVASLLSQNLAQQLVGLYPEAKAEK